MKSLSKLILVFASVLWGLNTSQAQIPSQKEKADKAEEIKRLIDEKNFVFKAVPEKDSSKVIAENGSKLPYVAVLRDTLIVNLSGQTKTDSVKFNGTAFGYRETRNKKGDWDIVIKPSTGMSDVKEMTMVVMPTGHASLRVIRSHGSPLSYVGYIKQEDY